MPKIRPANHDDIERMSALESICFCASEAASLSSFKARFAVFPECFFVLEVEGKVVGHINGCINDTPTLPDALYANAEQHNPDGHYQTIFGLVVDPDYQRRGYASLLVKHFSDVSQQRSLQGMVLTCKEHLLGFYEKHHYVCQGKSASTHGGSHWFDMVYRF